MRVLINALVIQFILTIYVFWRGWQILPKSKWVRIPFALIFITEQLIYFIGLFISDYLPTNILHYTVWLDTTWVVFVIYTTVLLLLYDLFRLLNTKKGLFKRYVDLQSKSIRKWYYYTSVLLVVGAMIYGNYSFHHPSITNMELIVKKDTPEVKSLKVVVVSDMHVGLLINREILKMYVDRIMEQKGDIILIAGDVIDYDLKSVKDQNMQEEFKRLQAPYGVYASTGNHDYIQLEEEEENEKIVWLEKESGLTLLRDTAVLIQNSFYVIGREDDKYEDRKPLPQILKDVDKNLPMIVINHEPHHLQQEAGAGVDIAVYGHTHNGQLFPVNLWINFLYEVGYGYKKKEDTHIYVTSGIGLAGPQYRIGTKSEILVLDVKFNN